MKCQKCNQNEATVHTCVIAGDKTKKFDLCETCAQTSGLMDPQAISLESLLTALDDTTGNSLRPLLDDSEEPPKD